MNRLFAFASLLIIILFVGCGTTPSAKTHATPPAERPTIAILNFDDQSEYRGSWNLQRLLPDLIEEQLANSKQLRLLERRTLNNLLGEILRQGDSIFNPSERQAARELSAADYVLAGNIIHFATTTASPSISLQYRLSRADTGEIIQQDYIRVKHEATEGQRPVDYTIFGFGSDSFRKTPLGEISQKLIQHIEYDILQALNLPLPPKASPKKERKTKNTTHVPQAQTQTAHAAATMKEAVAEAAAPIEAVAEEETPAMKQNRAFIKTVSNGIAFIELNGDNATALKPGEQFFTLNLNKDITGLVKIIAANDEDIAAEIIEGNVTPNDVLEPLLAP